MVSLLRGFGDNGNLIASLAQRFCPIVNYILETTDGGEGLGGEEDDPHPMPIGRQALPISPVGGEGCPCVAVIM
jgi:hypothetical protein